MVARLRELRRQRQRVAAEALEDEIDSLDLADAVISARDKPTYSWEDVEAEFERAGGCS
jgi:hypothetical protein